MQPHDFPVTRVSVIEALASADSATRRAAADLFAQAYWLPVATTLRIRWNLESADAEDLTQEFLSEALLKEWLARYDPARARFRTFLRMCADRFVSNSLQAHERLKRGGGMQMLAIDDESVSIPAQDDTDALFRHEWIRSVLALALQALEREAGHAGKAVHVAIFRAYDIDDAPGPRASYRDLAARFGLPETTITNHLTWARQSFKRHVLAALRSLAGSEIEFREDVQELLGIRIP